jgi:hypothetical protein
MHLLYGDFFALYKFNNQSINQSIPVFLAVIITALSSWTTGGPFSYYLEIPISRSQVNQQAW